MKKASLLALCAVACGGHVDTGAPAAPAPPPDCSLVSLTASPATVLLQDRDNRDPGSGLLVAPSLSMAGTPAGDRFLVVYVDGQGAHGLVVQPSAGGVAASTEIAVPEGLAGFDGQEFVVLSGSDSDGLGVQRIGLDGSLDGPVTRLGGSGQAQLARFGATVSIPSGAAFTWTRTLDDGTSEFHASAVGPGATLAHDSIILTGSSPGAAETGGAGSVGLLGDRPFAWTCSLPNAPPALTDLAWAGGVPSTTVVDGAPCPYRRPGSVASPFWPLLAVDGRLAVAATGSDPPFADGIYEGTPGRAFSRALPLPEYPVTQAVDGCGRFVGLADTAPDQASDSLFVEALGGSSVPITLGSLPLGVAVAPTPGGFVVVWFEWASSDPGARTPLPLKMTTLTWQ